MTMAFTALLPVFLVILAGAAIRHGNIVAEQHWQALDEICYRILFPCLLFKEIAAANFGAAPVWSMAMGMMTAVVIMSALLLALRKPLSAAMGLSAPQFASLFQGAARWNTFIALALIPTVVGPGALALGAVSVASMTPLLNVIVVWMHAATLGDGNVSPKTVAWSIISNPFVYSTLAGVAWKLLGLPLPWPVYDVLDIIAKCTLGMALLAVGAGLQFHSLREAKWPAALAVGLKLLVMPFIMFFCMKLFGVSGDAALVAVVCGAVPTASGAYVLARQLGGDAPMVANILTLQVIATAVTLPLVLTLAQ
jgi:malonate transporter and related proteins